MQYALVNPFMSLFIKRVSLSLINLLGIPNLVMICLLTKLATAAPVAFFRGMASTHFVKYSVVAKIHM